MTNGPMHKIDLSDLMEEFHKEAMKRAVNAGVEAPLVTVLSSITANGEEEILVAMLSKGGPISAKALYEMGSHMIKTMIERFADIVGAAPPSPKDMVH